MKRDREQRRAYARRRLFKAVDRFFVVETFAEKAQANRWAKAWAEVAGVMPKRRKE